MKPSYHIIPLFIFCTTILAMEQQESFSLSEFLKEHNWHERLAKLNPEQRDKLADFFGKQTCDSGEDIPRAQLAPIITQAMDYAEGKDILLLAVLDDSTEGIKLAIKMGADIQQQRDRKSPLFWGP